MNTLNNYTRLITASRDIFCQPTTSRTATNFNSKQTQKGQSLQFLDDEESRLYYDALDTVQDIDKCPLNNNCKMLSDDYNSQDQASTSTKPSARDIITGTGLQYEPDFKQVLDVLNQPSTLAYDWEEVLKDDKLKLYNHKSCSGTIIFNKFECILENVNPDWLFDLFVNLENRQFFEKKNKEILLEKFSDFADIIYVERKMPALISDRANTVFRCYISNKSHPQLCKEYGLPEQEEPYYALYMRTVDHPQAPKDSDVVKNKTFLNGWIVQRDPKNPKNTLLKACSHTDFGGSIPGWIMRQLSSILPKKVIESFYVGYKRYEAARIDKTVHPMIK